MRVKREPLVVSSAPKSGMAGALGKAGGLLTVR